ncbi:MAG: hypothetical protein U0R64_00635 [Candidatus Nanopelagicales bacterium]
MRTSGARRWLAVALTLALTMLAAPVTVAQASDSLGLTKTGSRTVIKPGEEMEYELTLTCSSLTDGCVDATITDVLPAGLEITSLPNSSSERTVNYDSGTRTLSVQYVIPLTSPPGTNGLPAGSARKVKVGVRLPAETDLTTGAVLHNTATGNAVGLSTPEATWDTSVEVPKVVRPVATKEWSPATAIAQSQSPSVITLGARNASSTSAEVTRLSVTDETPETFEHFTVTQLGPVTSYPPGTDRVIVATCTKPTATPCADGEWEESTPQSGTGAPLTPPVGVDLADVTGVRYTFLDQGDQVIPYSPTQGQVELHVELRDTERTSGDPIQPQSKLRIRNCASPSAVDSGDTTAGANACANFDIIPDLVAIGATKKIFPDQNGDYTQDGTIVVGQDSGVSMTITGKNNAGLPFNTMDLIEPSVGSPSEFDKIDATKARFTFPTGATEATLKVTCRSGADPADVVYTKPPSPNTVNVTDFGCVPGVYPGTVSVRFRGESGGDGTIEPGATGTLQIHGIAARVNGTDVTNKLQNCADAVAQAGATSSTATGCGETPVQFPTPSVGNGVKSSSGVDTIVPGQPMTFSLSFKNTGNIPVSNIYLVDPVNPAASGNPFDVIRLTRLRAVTTNPNSTLEVWDPTAGGGSGAYVTMPACGETSSGCAPGPNADLMARAKGIRIHVTQSMSVGQAFRAEYTVLLRDGVTPGTSFTNCASVGIGTPSRTPFCNNTEVTATPPTTSASLEKIIDPGSVIRPTPGLPAQPVVVKHRLKNNGSLYLSVLGMTDIDQDFFDAVTFAGNIHVNFPPGANRVQIDVCTTDCAGPTWITGTPTSSQSPGLPGGVTAADVNGIRATFTNSSSGYTILPGENFPNSGNCKNASVCFTVTPRETLKSNSDPIPASLSDTSDGTKTSEIGTSVIPEVTDTLDVVEGSSELKITKGPESRIGPGENAPIDLVIENTGTSPLVDPHIVDPLPAELTFDPNQPGAPPGQHYKITYELPAGTSEPAPGQLTFTEVPDLSDPNRVATLDWAIAGWNLPVGGKIKITYQVKLTPGTPADTDIVNTAGAHASNPGLTCAPGDQTATDDPNFGAGLFCLDDTTIRSLAGNAVDASKWSSGDPSLGFYNTSTDTVVSITDPVCPTTPSRAWSTPATRVFRRCTQVRRSSSSCRSPMRAPTGS